MKRIFRRKDAKMQRSKITGNRKQGTGNGEQILIIPFTVYRLPFTLLLFAIYSLLFTPLAFADDSSNWGIQPPPQVKQTPNESSEKVWEKEQHEKLYQDYGSQDSPAFLNREGVDPSTSEFEEKYDYQESAPYNYDAGGN